jgi:4-amino-4-deoxy-L-arabinose transferase-like glycosyltransferase
VRNPIKRTQSVESRAGILMRWLPELLVVALAGVLFLVNLTANGYANEYYSAAAWAGSKDWTAWLFSSVDPENFLATDKPPLSTMVMGLSVRAFGLSPLAILLPQALMGVATVVVLMATIRRSLGRTAGLIAGIVMATTPVSVVIFRYNNPDALLTLLLVCSAYALTRALEGGRYRWLLISGLLVGLGFEAKALQAFIVLPGFALTYWAAGRGDNRQRIRGLAIAAGAVAIAGSWWLLLVELTPPASRPNLDGSVRNSAIHLVLAQNGIGRFFSGADPKDDQRVTTSVEFIVGEPGPGRLFNNQFAGQVAWLLPLALGALAAGVVGMRARGSDLLQHAPLVLWGSWLITHVIALSVMGGAIRTYYAVTMVPALAALVAYGLTRPQRPTSSIYHRIVLPGLLVGSGVLSAAILLRTPSFLPGVWLIPLFGAAGAALFVALQRRLNVRSEVIAIVALIPLLVGPIAYSANSVLTPSSGGLISAGPDTALRERPAAGSPLRAIKCVDVGALDTATEAVILREAENRRWAVGVCGALNASTLQLRYQVPAMGLGGYFGNGSYPTLEVVQRAVREGEVTHFLMERRARGEGTQREISVWITSECRVAREVSDKLALFDCERE